ncbi:hypothetical protein K470DRAFT_255601 [Piedraia hortae CBS 480.64]|uniref:Uncharacterized protein n=1 Tax=Piedraia hortae CBS 480.64 TaxID=1314780 RepID=A0A6A7C6Q9_9PEZI|nr:hypothetical protein K470DRAFT_255601 [Piedraia hortae CBS 480.64]
MSATIQFLSPGGTAPDAQVTIPTKPQDTYSRLRKRAFRRLGREHPGIRSQVSKSGYGPLLAADKQPMDPTQKPDNHGSAVQHFCLQRKENQSSGKLKRPSRALQPVKNQNLYQQQGVAPLPNAKRPALVTPAPRPEKTQKLGPFLVRRQQGSQLTSTPKPSSSSSKPWTGDEVKNLIAGMSEGMNMAQTLKRYGINRSEGAARAQKRQLIARGMWPAQSTSQPKKTPQSQEVIDWEEISSQFPADEDIVFTEDETTQTPMPVTLPTKTPAPTLPPNQTPASTLPPTQTPISIQRQTPLSNPQPSLPRSVPPTQTFITEFSQSLPPSSHPRNIPTQHETPTSAQRAQEILTPFSHFQSSPPVHTPCCGAIETQLKRVADGLERLVALHSSGNSPSQNNQERMTAPAPSGTPKKTRRGGRKRRKTSKAA